jgi:hypothetical protein
MSYLPFVLEGKEEEVIPTLYYLFMYEGLPTEDYKSFLLDVVSHLSTADTETRLYLQSFLMRCEEGAYMPINGIISIASTDPRYQEYTDVLHAVYGNSPGLIHGDTAYISNTAIVHTIQLIESGCKYRSCYRNNPLHKKLMHKRLQLK